MTFRRRRLPLPSGGRLRQPTHRCLSLSKKTEPSWRPRCLRLSGLLCWSCSVTRWGLSETAAAAGRVLGRRGRTRQRMSHHREGGCRKVGRKGEKMIGRVGIAENRPSRRRRPSDDSSMCGRFLMMTSGPALAERFDLSSFPELKPRYNITPSQQVPMVRLGADGGRQLELLRWGLVPSWADDPAIGYRMINARSETVSEKPSFRAAFKHRRCLVLADGFFEWQPRGGKKQPWLFRLKEGEPFAFAGLWERWEKGEGDPLETCTIITT